jgi:hypothetical protein
MTLPVPNMQAPLVSVKGPNGKEIGKGFLVSPWNSFFQQLVQPAPAVVDVTQNPFTANANGTVIITGASTVTLTRGTTVIGLTGQIIIPISIGDTVSWTGPATVQFLGA